MSLMKRVDAFLRDNDITYYLLGGSMIGAMRHGGFIPWDDDLDIMIGRSDFNRLAAMSDDLGTEDLEFVCFENDPCFSKPYGMFSRTVDTCTSTSRIYWGGRCMGTAIDVFVLDDMYSGDKEEFIHALLLHQEVISRVKIYKEDILKYRDEYLAYKARENEIGKPAVVKELRQKLESFAEGDCDTRVVTTWGMKLRDYPAEWVAEPKYVQYEDAMLPVPTKPEACLRLQYGYNWYMIPETAEQIAHGFFQNKTISYNNYYADIDNFIDWDEAYGTLDGRKRIKVDTLGLRLSIRDFRNELMANMIMMRFESMSEDERLSLSDEGRHEEFLASMEPLLANRASFAGNDAASALSALVCGSWIKELIYAGRYYDAMKVRNIFLSDTVRAELTDELGLLAKVTQLAAAWQDHDADGMTAAMAEIPVEYHDTIPDCILSRARLAEEESGGDTPDDLISVCRSYLEGYPHNYDIMKLLGDLLWQKDDKKEAESLYLEVNENSRNGLDLLDITKRFGYTPGYLKEIIALEGDDEDEH